MRSNRILPSLVVAIALLTSADAKSEEIIEPTGIGQITEIIASDARLQKRVTAEDRTVATNSATKMNELIKEAIFVNGLANDNAISAADTREINRYLVQHYSNEWYELRGQASGEYSTGYYAVEKKRASQTVAMNRNAISVWGLVYNLGFAPYNKKRLADTTGAKSAPFTQVGYYLSEMLQNDLTDGALANPDFNEVTGTTGTSLDGVVDAIMSDPGLSRRVSTSDLREGAESADAMNHLIIEAIISEGLANDKALTTADIRQINSYLVANHLEKWSELHGDDENSEETGFHLVQNDGAYTRLFAENVVNSVADGMYHLGFETDKKHRLQNEDGNANKRFEKVAWWLDMILKDDLQSGALANPDIEEIVGTTGTTFDHIIPYIYNDEGLLLNVSTADIRAGAKSADGMNRLIVEAIKSTGVALDDYISVDDVKALNRYLVENYAWQWSELHGDDEQGEETGYHRIQNDGAKGIAYNRNVINKLADGIYHLGFETPYKNRLANEDGNKNVSFKNVAYWLNKSLKKDFEADKL